jgi:hypothetical protein
VLIVQKLTAKADQTRLAEDKEDEGWLLVPTSQPSQPPQVATAAATLAPSQDAGQPLAKKQCLKAPPTQALQAQQALQASQQEQLAQLEERLTQQERQAPQEEELARQEEEAARADGFELVRALGPKTREETARAELREELKRWNQTRQLQKEALKAQRKAERKAEQEAQEAQRKAEQEARQRALSEQPWMQHEERDRLQREAQHEAEQELQRALLEHQRKQQEETRMGEEAAHNAQQEEAAHEAQQRADQEARRQAVQQEQQTQEEASTQGQAALASTQGQEEDEVDYGGGSGDEAAQQEGPTPDLEQPVPVGELQCAAPPCRSIVEFDGTNKCFVVSSTYEMTHHIRKVLMMRRERLMEMNATFVEEPLDKGQVSAVLKQLRLLWEEQPATKELAKASLALKKQCAHIVFIMPSCRRRSM